MKRKVIRIISLLSIALSLIVTPAFAEYDRKEWRHWIDADKDCQDTRQETLIRDSLAPAVLSENGCKVISGVWVGQYTHEVFTDPRKLDADHIVPLKWAYDNGGADWSKAMRRAFANDPENVIPVKASANRQKGAKGPGEWMPLFQKCEYLRQWRSIVNRYDLKLKQWPDCH